MEPMSQHRNTPEEVLVPVREFFGGQIPLDPCPNEWSTVDPAHTCVDGLAEPWLWGAFVNPPWTGIVPWAQKAVAEREVGTRDILLWLPCYPETAYSRLLYSHACRVGFWKKRVDHPVEGKLSKGSMWSTQLIYLGSRRADFDRVFTQHATLFIPL